MHLLSRRLSSSLRLRQHHGLRAVLVLLCVLLGASWSLAQSTEPTYGLPTHLSGKAEVSFLASDPHAAASYTLYGHAGLRIQDPEQGIDVTFNYGLFDFSEDFTWRFIQGKTDYIVAPMATADYFAEYLSHGAVHEVGLVADSLQLSRLWASLLENIQPEHRTYRYNAFRDNCSTRPLELYFASLRAGGKAGQGSDTLALVGSDPTVDSVLAPQTWRAVINRLEASSPWLVLGTDLAMGTQLDAPLTLRERFFIPTDAAVLLPYVRYGLGKQSSDPWISPVAYTKTYGESQPVRSSEPWITHPVLIFTLLILACAGWAEARRRGKRLPYLLETLVFTGAGLAGLLLFFLVFVSEHPMITTNWNLLVLHPFYLLFPLLALGGRRTARLRYRLHAVSNLTIALFPLVTWWAGQSINPSVYLIGFSLFLLQWGQMKACRSTSYTAYAPQEA